MCVHDLVFSDIHGNKAKASQAFTHKASKDIIRPHVIPPHNRKTIIIYNSISNKNNPIHHSLFTIATIGVSFIGYGGQTAYAACANTGGTTYVCSGANAATQTIISLDPSVSTQAGFSVNTGASKGLQILADGALSFVDNNDSNITSTAADQGLFAFINADNGGTPGSIAITTSTGTSIQGGTEGIAAVNNGSGATTLDLSGNVTGTGNIGIYTLNNGTNLNITTTTGSSILGANEGISTTNNGNGATTLNISGNVTGTNTIGIYNLNNSGTDINITSAAGTSILGANEGISTTNNGSGATTLDLSGNVTGTGNIGIYTLNNGTENIITIRAGSTVQGGGVGFLTTNNGSGATTLDISGTLNGGNNSMRMLGGNRNDSLILRTGAALSSTNGANLDGGSDTLTLVGNGNEDEIFLNIETVEVNADATGWALSSTSAFDDLNVNTGLFRNNGNITVSNALTVASGASFGGTGTTISNVTNNGFMTPGNSVGTQNITGNFAQGSAGTLAIEFDNTGVDLLDITGTANIDGAVTFTEFGAGVSLDTPLTFLDAAGGLTGSFATLPDVVATSDGVVQANVSIGATAATVTFTPGTGLNDVASNSIASSAARALDNASGGDAANVVDITNTINSSPSPDQALSSQSGIATKAATSSAAAALKNVGGIAQTRLSPQGISGINAGDEISSYDGRRTLWLQGVGGFGEIDSDANAQGADYDFYGAAVGFEVDLDGKSNQLGIFFGYAKTDSDVKELNDSSEVDSYQLGLYGSKHLYPNWYLSGSLSAAYLDFATTRITNVGTAQADFDGYGGFVQAELLHDPLGRDDFIFSPYIGVEASIIDHEDYQETGANTLNMNVDGNTSTQFSSIIGLQYQNTYQVQGYKINPAVKIGWAHQCLDATTNQTSRFASATSAVANSEGPKQNRDSARLGIDISATTANKATELYLNYDNNIAPDYNSHSFTAGAKLHF